MKKLDALRTQPPFTSRHVWGAICRDFNRGPTEEEARALSKEYKELKKQRAENSLPTDFASFLKSKYDPAVYTPRREHKETP